MSRKNRKTPVKQVIQPANANAGANVGANPNDGIDRSPAKVAETKAVPKRRIKRKNKSDGSKRFDFKESQAAACQSVYIKKSDITTIITIGAQILGEFIAALDQKLMSLKVLAFKSAFQDGFGLSNLGWGTIYSIIRICTNISTSISICWLNNLFNKVFTIFSAHFNEDLCRIVRTIITIIL